jgi:hypothetical protein
LSEKLVVESFHVLYVPFIGQKYRHHTLKDKYEMFFDGLSDQRGDQSIEKDLNVSLDQLGGDLICT